MSQLALDQQQGDRRTRQVVVYTLCGIAWMFCMTVCYLAIRGMMIPDPLDRLATFVVGNISGMLIKTAADKIIGAPGEPVPVTTEPGKPVETTDVTISPNASPNIAANLPPTTGDTQPE